jgi:hypothetical protein
MRSECQSKPDQAKTETDHTIDEHVKHDLHSLQATEVRSFLTFSLHPTNTPRPGTTFKFTGIVATIRRQHICGLYDESYLDTVPSRSTVMPERNPDYLGTSAPQRETYHICILDIFPNLIGSR